jgi:hypothetical protein
LFQAEPASTSPGRDLGDDGAEFFGDRSGVTPTNKTGQRISVHGIVCPAGSYQYWVDSVKVPEGKAGAAP